MTVLLTGRDLTSGALCNAPAGIDFCGVGPSSASDAKASGPDLSFVLLVLASVDACSQGLFLTFPLRDLLTSGAQASHFSVAQC